MDWHAIKINQSTKFKMIPSYKKHYSTYILKIKYIILVLSCSNEWHFTNSVKETHQQVKFKFSRILNIILYLIIPSYFVCLQPNTYLPYLSTPAMMWY